MAPSAGAPGGGPLRGAGVAAPAGAPGGGARPRGCPACARPPLAPGPCVKVAFPLPNGNASVFLEPGARPDGSRDLVSPADAFGGPGFYFVVARGGGTVAARHVPQLTERIHVYVD